MLDRVKIKFIYSEKANFFCEISTVDFAKICSLLRIYELYEEKIESIKLIFDIS